MLGGNESETNVINGNTIDVDHENDTNLEVNEKLTYMQRVASAMRTKLMCQMVVN